MDYSRQKVEEKWQNYWLNNKTFVCNTWGFDKPKCYVPGIFPYPSESEPHVGHSEGYAATGVVCRMKHMQGYNVLHPMSWDAFRLPAGQFAIITGNHPAELIRMNIDHFRKQIRALDLSYDQNRGISMTDPSYYEWTQWIFLKLYDKGLAYAGEVPVNWCPESGTMFANGEVIDGKSERGGFPATRKPMRQWVLKITEYVEYLLKNLELCNWSAFTKEMQISWIGKSKGANIVFKIKDTKKKFTVFTIRCDTLSGTTYCVMAPERPYTDGITTRGQKGVIDAYKTACATKSDLERIELNKEEAGVFIGAYTINPVNGKEVPIWIPDYVLTGYGTGATAAAPTHDTHGWEFAGKSGIDIISVLKGGDVTQEAYTEDGVHINSGFLGGMGKQEVIDTVIAWLEEHAYSCVKTTYRLRDWLFSGQRYWGEPISIMHMEGGTARTVDIDKLPLELPEAKNSKPSGSGESSLAHCKDWLNMEISGVKGKHETNTMPQWAGSCWCYLCYVDPKNGDATAVKELLKHWLSVDLYVGGAGRAVLHLLYTRF